MPAKAYSTKGLKMWLGGATAPVALVPTAISKAKPTMVTVANTAKAGDMVYVGKYSGTDAGEDHRIVREDDILGIIE